MAYEFDLVLELATELGFDARLRLPTEVALDLGGGAVLMFVNDDNDEHSLIGFDDESGWHYHGDLGSVDPRGWYVDLDYLAVVSGLADGSVLVCEH